MGEKRESLTLPPEMWDRLEEIAAETGSTAQAGPTYGEPSWRSMIRRIAEGQLEVNKMPDTVLARGSKWSSSELYNDSSWDPHDVLSDAEISELGDRVRDRFHELAEEAGCTDVFWTPHTSEVIGPVGSADDVDLDALRQQADSEIWEALVDGEIFPEAADTA